MDYLGLLPQGLDTIGENHLTFSRLSLTGKLGRHTELEEAIPYHTITDGVNPSLPLSIRDTALI